MMVRKLGGGARLTCLLFLSAAALSCDAPSAGQAPAERKAAAPALATAIFAGGCFWCTEADFEKLPGVRAAVSGYTGGRVPNPTYEMVTRDNTGHYEAVRVTYDPSRISYQALVRHFFRTVDPTDAGGQFCDRGSSYRTAIFVSGEQQQRIAQAEKALAAKTLRRPVVTPVLAAAPFYAAEGYHQDYYKKNPIRYRFYRLNCGRDAKLRQVWGKK